MEQSMSVKRFLPPFRTIFRGVFPACGIRIGVKTPQQSTNAKHLALSSSCTPGSRARHPLSSLRRPSSGPNPLPGSCSHRDPPSSASLMSIPADSESLARWLYSRKSTRLRQDRGSLPLCMQCPTSKGFRGHVRAVGTAADRRHGEKIVLRATRTWLTLKLEVGRERCESMAFVGVPLRALSIWAVKL